MKIIFCQDPISGSSPDSMYIDEVAATTHAGLSFELLDYATIVNHNNPVRAVRDISVHSPLELAIYRGWMLSASHYAVLYDALGSRGIQLINNAEQYRYTHHLPQSMPLIKKHTPQTVWMETDGKQLSYDAIMQLLLPFSGQSLVMKDFVKSAKHYWYQACYIPSASDATAVKNTVDYFLKIRGDDLEGGLVFREFMEFKPLADHPASRMPLIKEYRLFFLHGERIDTVRYWDIEGYEETEAPPDDLFSDIARQVRSNFFTMDVAQRLDGEWMIIELGDGQVAGLPATTDLDAFYRRLSSIS